MMNASVAPPPKLSGIALPVIGNGGGGAFGGVIATVGTPFAVTFPVI